MKFKKTLSQDYITNIEIKKDEYRGAYDALRQNLLDATRSMYTNKDSNLFLEKLVNYFLPKTLEELSKKDGNKHPENLKEP